MPFGKSFVDNPLSKGHKIERREFYARDADFEQMCKVVPFVIGGEPTAHTLWRVISLEKCKFSLAVTGVDLNTLETRQFTPPLGRDRVFVLDGGNAVEVRAYPSTQHKNDMLKVVPPNQIAGFACMAWWESKDPASPDSNPVLCTGLVPAKGAVAPTGDGMEHKSKEELLTIAGTSGIREASKEMEEGEIIALIRDKKAKKNKKEPVTV